MDAKGVCPDCGQEPGFGPGFPGPLGRRPVRKRLSMRTVFLILAVLAALVVFSLQTSRCTPTQEAEDSSTQESSEPPPDAYFIDLN
ncbi:MAG: hypothetical protein D6E12_13630 [Desulfovibrio sp.]|nr:MAG: hypothetical protein D6E12_13630 [Desulfovibrio sp.]